MTRINVVDPQELTNAHLMAEYRELPRIFTLVKNAQSKGKRPKDFNVDTYRLGAGHCTFFYKRLAWLQERYNELVKELYRRDFNINPIRTFSLLEGLDHYWFGWYSVTTEALQENRERIAKRLSGDKL